MNNLMSQLSIGLLIGLMTNLFSTASFAGGSSVAGVGAPQLIYVCYEFNYKVDGKNKSEPPFQVTVAKLPPTYELKLIVLDRKNKRMSEELTTEIPADSMGGPLSYVSPKFQLSIQSTGAPIIEKEHIFHSSQLTYGNKPFRNLKCERRN